MRSSKKIYALHVFDLLKRSVMCNEFRHIIVNVIVGEDHIMEILTHDKENWQEYSSGYDSTHRGGIFNE